MEAATFTVPLTPAMATRIRLSSTPVSVMLPLRQLGGTMTAAGLAAAPAWILSRVMFAKPGVERLVTYVGVYGLVLASILLLALRERQRRALVAESA